MLMGRILEFEDVMEMAVCMVYESKSGDGRMLDILLVKKCDRGRVRNVKNVSNKDL